MKKILLLFVVGLISLSYGVLVGRYEIFPYGILKTLQDRFEEKKSNQKSEEEALYSEIAPANLITVSPRNLDSLKIKLNTIIFGTKTLPTNLPDTVFEIEDELYFDLASLEKIEQFNLSQKYDINSIGYVFHPKEPNNRLMIYHQGHRGDFILGKKSIQLFVEKGFTVYAFCMPLKGKNNKPMIYLDKLGEFQLDNHNKFKFLENPLEYLISPVITMINYSKGKNFDDITMIGISGGGWTTTLTAAVDTRIKFSFPVAGSYPMYIRFLKQNSYAHFEQTYEKLYSQINYLDMYIMGAVGKGRTQIQILNKYDPCCYDGNDFKSYDYIISEKVQEFEDGYFEVFSDSSHVEHKISELALSKIFEVINSAPNKK